MSIHPSAIISSKAKIGHNVSIGPYTVIEGDVSIGDHSSLSHHVIVGCPQAKIKIGKGNKIFPFAVIGSPSLDLTEKGDEAYLHIGDENIFREYFSVNLGSPEKSKGLTEIGSHNLFMAYVHISHDCRVGSNVVIANASQFAGHVIIEDHVKVSGICGVTQFVRLGKYSYIGGDSTANKDVLPYSIAQGKFATMRATNKIGLERAHFSDKDIQNIHRAIRIFIKGNLPFEEAVEKVLKECKPSEYINDILKFARSSEKGLAR